MRGTLPIPGPDSLSGYHSASGGQGGKDIEDQQIDKVNQGYAGDRGLSG